MMNGDPPASHFRAYETLPEDAAPGAPVHERAGDSFGLRRAAYANDAMPERRTDGWEKVKERRESGSPWPFNRRAKTAHVKVEMRRSNSYLRAHYFQFDAAHGALKPQRRKGNLDFSGKAHNHSTSLVEWLVRYPTKMQPRMHRVHKHPRCFAVGKARWPAVELVYGPIKCGTECTGPSPGGKSGLHSSG
ncbi:hypothetical protein B0H13DRAFT_1855917 [Mycena leptocephala]|nr:hypothetical protein B0H13DRAFT_1855917 [Mycena leptocephala]